MTNTLKNRLALVAQQSQINFLMVAYLFSFYGKQVIPQDDNWGDNTTAITGNTSETGFSMEDLAKFAVKDNDRQVSPIHIAIIIIKCCVMLAWQFIPTKICNPLFFSILQLTFGCKTTLPVIIFS